MIISDKCHFESSIMLLEASFRLPEDIYSSGHSLNYNHGLFIAQATVEILFQVLDLNEA